ncbi:MAG: nucleoside kinase, partial [Lachnospiraceae bacterium]|nr:nucleoside kinase [Lachnospiraceae bacterium]
EVYKYNSGLLLQLPKRTEPDRTPPLKDYPKLFECMKTSNEWGTTIKCDTVGALNDIISSGRIKQFILLQEALQESRMGGIAAKIKGRGSKFVMIAGPSSSGKTTFSHRISVQLMARGLNPRPIALDDYFLDRDKTPLDKDGNKDYESLEALDVQRFNEDMTGLLEGKEVQLPKYNFITGMSEKGSIMKLEKDDILVLEGIHGLNDKLSYTLPRESKYKIYLSALTTLNIDEHNRIPTTDNRLIRRMVRDHRTRGASASRTLGMWNSVRRGEDENIFPYQEEADAMFNSALIYELAVLKIFAEPLLFGIPDDDPNYQEAVRLLKFLQYFLGVNSEDLPNNSLIREFIGGSIFNV